MEKIRVTTLPKEIIAVHLECILMPNGELISNGKSLGWIAAFPNSIFLPEE